MPFNSRFVVALSAILLSTTLVQTAQARHSDNPKLGINVGSLGKLTTSIPFTDIFKISRGWFTSCAYDWRAKRPLDPGCTAKTSLNTQEQDQLQLDGNGWVRALPTPNEAPVFTSVTSTWRLSKHFPTGRYVVLYEGEGKMEITGDLKMVNDFPGHKEFDLLSPKRNLKLQILTTDPRRNGNYIRNIRIVPKAFEKNYKRTVFNPNYIARIRPLHSLRFMPWTNPRGNKAVEWNQRATIGAAHYTGDNGVPAERMIDLANAVNATPFVSIPYMASDDYMKQYARMVKNRLRKNHKVYVEFSNEVWNSIFPASTYAARKADKLWNFPYPKVPAGKRRVLLATNWYAKRSVEMCNIWKQEFGAERDRVKCMLGTLTSVPWLGQEMVDCPLWKEAKGCGRYMDAYGIGPYFGDYIAKQENRAEVLSWTRDADGGKSRLFQEILHGGVLKNSTPGGAIAQVKTRMDANRKIANKYNLEMLAYEGGQHLIRYDPPHTVKNPKVLNLFMSAQKDPRMKIAYQRYLELWQQNGGGLMMHFYGIGEPEPKNFFGMLDYLEQPSTPKYQALMDYLGSNTTYVPPRKRYVPPPATRAPARQAPPRAQAPVRQPAVRQPTKTQPRQQQRNPAPQYYKEESNNVWDDFLSEGMPTAPTRRALPFPTQQRQQATAPRAPARSGRALSGNALRGWSINGNTATSPPIKITKGKNSNFSVVWRLQNVRNTAQERFRIYSVDQRGGRKVLLEQTARDIAEVKDHDQIFEDNFNRYIGPPIRVMFEVTGGLEAVINKITY
ncbi:MAG TPA: hypothetical protein EYH16_01935 [Leucothrix mucor]|nr:hypothetical protein [Leucothrix mucor]